MLLHPTDKELEEARGLGIDPSGMNGPQIREAIKKANLPGVRPSFRDNKRFAGLVFVADKLGVVIHPGDGVDNVKERIEEHFVEVFEKRQIRPHATLRFTGSAHAGKEAQVTSTTIWWHGDRPMMNLSMAGRACPVVAYNVVLHTVTV